MATSLDTIAFVGTNLTDELITSGLPVTLGTLIGPKRGHTYV
jgi:hypothetical protein